MGADDRLDWAALQAAAAEEVLELRFGKRDLAAARSALAAEAKRFHHDYEHLQGVVLVDNPPDESASAKLSLATVFSRFARSASATTPHGNDAIAAAPLDARYLVLDGQALLIYFLTLPVHDAAQTLDRETSRKGDPVSKLLQSLRIAAGDGEAAGIIDKKRTARRIGMVGSTITCDQAAGTVTISFGEDVPKLAFRPVDTGAGATLDDWVQKLRIAASSSFKADYKVIKRLGEGAYAKVFLCQDRKTAEEFAVKVVEFDTGDENSRVYMRRESSILALLEEHPNIVTVRDVYEEPNRMYFVMSKLACDLFAYMQQKGALDEKKARLVMHQVLRGIAHLHDAGITHRDIKPKNIVLNSLADVRITDFGSARVLQSAGIGMSMGLEKSVAGSGGFVAPEIIARKPYGRKCDLWSAGVLLYYMLSHELPFDAPTEVLTYAAIMKGKFKMSGPKWDKISVEAKDLISSLIVLDQDERLRAPDALAHPWFSVGQ